MAKKQETKISIFWSPEEVGEQIEGTFLRFERGQFRDGSDSYGVLIMVKGQMKKVGLTKVLMGIFQPIAEKLKSGTKLKFRYDGLGEKKPGWNAPKLFTVWIAGKLQESAFGVALTGKETADKLALALTAKTEKK